MNTLTGQTQIPVIHTPDQNLAQIQTNVNKVFRNTNQQVQNLAAIPFMQGQALTVALSSGANTFNHNLGRQPVGWFVIDQNASASIYRSANFNTKTLTLTSSAAVTVNLWIF